MSTRERNSSAGAAPTVSVITPCFNAAPRIGTSIEAVLSQSYSDWELIIVDDGSTDGAADVVRAFSDPRIQLIEQPNGGPSAARNTGLKQARGTYIAFLDADDSWDGAFLGRMVDALEARPEAALAYCGWQNLGVAGGRGAPFIPPDYERPDKVDTLLGGCRWPIHAAVTRAHRIREVGGFDESLRASVDYDLWLRVACWHPVVQVPEVLAYYHHHEGEQVTKNRLRVALSHWRAQRKLLATHPEIERQLGRRRVRQLLIGELLQRGYRSYWDRDLATARVLFRTVIRHGYGKPRDWLYMLPSVFPERWHNAILDARERKRR